MNSNISPKLCPLNGETLNKSIVGNIVDWNHSTGKPCYHWLGHTCHIVTEQKEPANA